MRIVNYFLSAILLLAFACTNTQNKKEDASATTEVVSTDTEVQDVAAVMSNGSAHNQKEVVLKGTVVHVCKHSGKRLHLMSDDEKTWVRVEAGTIGKFDKELEGSEIVVSGTFIQEVIDEEYLAKWSEQMAGSGQGEHHSEEEMAEEQSQMEQYRQRVSGSPDGKFVSSWVEGISFELADDGKDI